MRNSRRSESSLKPWSTSSTARLDAPHAMAMLASGVCAHHARIFASSLVASLKPWGARAPRGFFVLGLHGKTCQPR